MGAARTGKEVFGDAIELAPSEREEFVRRACGRDGDLLAEVRELLAAHGAAPGFLGMPTVGERHASAGLVVEGPGSVIGKYRLLERIGEGGFGVVFVAEQREPVARRVALKVIKPGMDTARVIARFEAERQALAVMEHPNIARVLDGGTTDSGRPYFVMELVAGRPITEYCDERRLSIPARLALFTQVCRAVQHAHQKGVIHRDLSPRNILVVEQDGTATARVIDFGIAKAVNQGRLERTVFTEQGQIIGTPEYMSPEQAAGGPDIDTRADVYSLGVLLYELLTGTTPFDPRSLRSAAFDELRRIIREDEPPRPSTRLSSLLEPLPAVAARRGVDAARLGTIIRGELDWIVLKAMDKDRSRRYHSAEGLAADVERYLGGAAVEAAPPSRRYRLGKFVHRHRVVVATATLVGLALVLGLGTALWESRIAARERDTARKAANDAVAARNQAQAREKETEQVAAFQASQLNGIDAGLMGRRLREDLLADAKSGMERMGVPDDEVRARQGQLDRLLGDVNLTNVALRALDENIFVRALTAVDEQFKEQPVVRARLLVTLGETLTGLGLHERATGPLSEGLELRRRTLGDDDPATQEAVTSMGRLLKARGKLGEAEACCREVVGWSARVRGESDPRTLGVMGNLAVVLQARGKLGEAERYYKAVLDGQRRILGPDDPNLILAVGNMGVLLEVQGKLDQAEPYMREALEKHRRVLGDDARFTMKSISNLGSLLHKMGRLGEAEPLLREALERRRRVLGEDHPDTLRSMTNLGVLLRSRNEFPEAERYLIEVLERSRSRLGDNHPFTIQAMGNLGELRRWQDRLPEAEALVREALERDRRTLSADHPDTLTSMCMLAALRRAQGDPVESERLYREAIAGFERKIGPDHAAVGQARSELGAVLLAAGRRAEAREALLEAERALRVGHSGPKSYVDCLRSLVSLNEACEAAEPGRGHAAEAAEWRAKLGSP